MREQRLGVDAYNLLQVIYNCCLGCTCLVVWCRGGGPERLGTASLAACSFATQLVANIPALEVGAAEMGVLLVDLTLLAIVLLIALKTDRFWPLWVCGFHLVGTGTHLVMLVQPDILPEAYRLVRGLWAYPMMVAIVVGTLGPTGTMTRNEGA